VAIACDWRFYTLDADLRLTSYCSWLHDYFGQDMRGQRLYDVFPGTEEDFGGLYRQLLAGETITGAFGFWGGTLYELHGEPLGDGLRVTYRPMVALDMTNRRSLIESLAALSDLLGNYTVKGGIVWSVTGRSYVPSTALNC
jgi:hypothetical protein